MLSRWRHKKRCSSLAGKCINPALKRYLEACGGLDTGNIVNTPIISVDLELTGLDAGANKIISMGWVLIDGGRIQLGSSRHLLILSDHSVGSSAAIHELMDNELAEGLDISEGLEQLFEAATGRVWVFHHAGLDIAFLQKACIDWAGQVPPFVVLDTMRIELGLRKRRDIPVQQGDLQLSKLRSTYNLPRYTAHNAMTDAFATAELLLAIAARMAGNGTLSLGPYLKFY